MNILAHLSKRSGAQLFTCTLLRGMGSWGLREVLPGAFRFQNIDNLYTAEDILLHSDKKTRQGKRSSTEQHKVLRVSVLRRLPPSCAALAFVFPCWFRFLYLSSYTTSLQAIFYLPLCCPMQEVKK